MKEAIHTHIKFTTHNIVTRYLHFFVLNHREHRGHRGKIGKLWVLCGEILSGATKSAKVVIVIV
jgi:hypothetical protein